jgi:hypothetical protein
MPSQEAMLDHIDALKSRLQSVREKSGKSMERMAGLGAMIAGGALHGYLAGARAGKELFGLSEATWIGGGATLVGLFGLAGTHSPMVEKLGAGMLACETSKAIAARVRPSGSTAGVDETGRLVDMGDLKNAWEHARRAGRSAD